MKKVVVIATAKHGVSYPIYSGELSRAADAIIRWRRELKDEEFFAGCLIQFYEIGRDGYVGLQIPEPDLREYGLLRPNDLK